MADGKMTCPIEGYGDVWVQFKTSGYPFSLTRTLDKSRDAQVSLTIILKYIIDWNVRDIDGGAIELPSTLDGREASLLDNVDEALTTWIVKAFYTNRAEIITSKNSLPSSPKAS